MNDIFEYEDAYGVLGINPRCMPPKESKVVPPKTKYEILDSHKFTNSANQSDERWVNDGDGTYHFFANRETDILWLLPQSPLVPGLLVGADPRLDADIIEGEGGFFLWLATGDDKDDLYSFLGMYSLMLRPKRLTAEQYEVMNEESRDHLMVSIEFADEPQGSGADDLEPIPEQGPLYNYEVKAEAIANDVDFSEDGIMDALKKGNLNIPVFRLEPECYDPLVFGDLYGLDSDYESDSENE